MLWHAAVPGRRGGDDHCGGCGVGAQRLGLLRGQRLERGEGCEGVRGPRRSSGQVGGGVGLRYSPWWWRRVLINSCTSARYKTSGRCGRQCCVVYWSCEKERRSTERNLECKWKWIIPNVAQPLKMWFLALVIFWHFWNYFLFRKQTRVFPQI